MAGNAKPEKGEGIPESRPAESRPAETRPPETRPAETLPPQARGLPTKETVLEALRPVHDPELMISIVDLGLIYDVGVSPDGKALDVAMTLTSPGCPIGPELMAAVDHTARMVPGVEKVEVRLVWDPPWDPVKMASDAAREHLGIW